MEAPKFDVDDVKNWFHDRSMFVRSDDGEDEEERSVVGETRALWEELGVSGWPLRGG